MSESIGDLIANYRRHAAEHGAATEAGDHKEGNAHHDRLIEVVGALRRRGAEGDHALLDLLSDENPWVRIWAATHSLTIDEAQAHRTLDSLSTEPGIIGFDAQMVLTEWEKGSLRIP